jgi:hypothetical protein
LSESPPVRGLVLGLSISQVLSDVGYLGLALLMVAETVFPPIPSEVVLPLAGYLVQQGDFSFVPALIASTAGSLVGAVLLRRGAAAGGRLPTVSCGSPAKTRPSSTTLSVGFGAVAGS